MRRELLLIPERRTSFAPELMRFFEELGDEDWFYRFEKFLSAFAGAKDFKIPSPIFLFELKRDENLVSRLRRDPSVKNRIEIMIKHDVRYPYLAEIYRAVVGQELPEPAAQFGREKFIEEAGAWMRKYPSLRDDVATLYRLNAAETAQATGKPPMKAGVVRKPVVPPKKRVRKRRRS